MVWAIIIVVLSAIPGNYFPELQTFANWLGPDKIVHLALYFVFYYLVGKGILKHYQTKKKPLLAGVLLVVIFGGVLEVLQHFLFIGRNGNMYDFFANLAGCASSYLLILYIERKKVRKSN